MEKIFDYSFEWTEFHDINWSVTEPGLYITLTHFIAQKFICAYTEVYIDGKFSIHY